MEIPFFGDFNFHITSCPLLSSNILSATTLGIFILRLYSILGFAPLMTLLWTQDFPISSFFHKRICHGTLDVVIEQVLWSIRGTYSWIGSLHFLNVKWHSGAQSYTMALSIDHTLHRFMSLLLNLTLFRILHIERFPWNICHGCSMPTDDFFSSGHIVLSHLGLLYVLMLRLGFLKLAAFEIWNIPWNFYFMAYLITYTWLLHLNCLCVILCRSRRETMVKNRLYFWYLVFFFIRFHDMLL